MAIDVTGRKKADGEVDVEAILDELEKKVERLKTLYEQYFMGIERMEPGTARKEVSRKMLELTQMNIRNTAQRYRFNALNQKWGVYTTYWNRTLRAIENGTYIRSVSKVARDSLRKGLEVPEEVLRAMPERMRDAILMQRAKVAEKAAREEARKGGASALEARKLGKAAGEAARHLGPAAARPAPAAAGDDLDLDKMFSDMTSEAQEDERDRTNPSLTMPEGLRPPPPAPAPPAQERDDGAFDTAHPRVVRRAATPPPAPAPRAAPPSIPPPAHAPRPAPGPPAARAGGTLPPGMDERATQDLYRRYVQAKKLMGEDTSALKYEHIVSTINKQAPKIMEQHKASGVEFAVVIKENKVILKATPKK